MKKLLLLLALVVCSVPAFATTWYVRPDGGTRYSVNKTSGQCNGQYDAPYPGTGVNQNCAFNDVRYLWADGSYTTGSSFPGWGWVGQGGDTYIIDCPTDCRVGYSGPNSNSYTLGIAGNPYASGAPLPPAGTPDAHTRILGKNYQNCQSDALKAHINGGYGTSTVFRLSGASYVDLACFDITDHSQCGRSGQKIGCQTSYPLDDYAGYGIATSNTTTNTTITDVRIHGMAVGGMLGPTGDGVALERVSLVGNPSAGWNLDAGNGQTGTGRLTLDHVKILWSGCSEEYPIVDPLPYQDCTDDTSGGYGDGMGTATVASNPAWTVTITNSVAAYNTQDGFDLLHLQGNGSTLTITNSVAFGNMGQQLKVGAASIARNNLLIGNCNALRQPINGTPVGYNAKLGDFCRAADTAVVVNVSDEQPTYFQNNTILSATKTGLEIDCHGTCDAGSVMIYQNNMFVGYLNNTDDGYPAALSSNDYSNPIYMSVSGLFTHPGSLFDHNLTFHPKSTWKCPASFETNGLCVDPQSYEGYITSFNSTGLMLPVLSSISGAVGAGIPLDAVQTDIVGNVRSNPPSIGAMEYMPISGLTDVDSLQRLYNALNYYVFVTQ